MSCREYGKDEGQLEFGRESRAGRRETRGHKGRDGTHVDFSSTDKFTERSKEERSDGTSGVEAVWKQIEEGC